MAVIKNNKSGLSGCIGDLQYRVVNGEQIVATKPTTCKNPKTVSQMAHRVKWSNISAMYRAADGALYNAFEEKKGNTNDYNLFMSANLYQKYEVYLTKEEKSNGACVVAPYQVSRGKLPSIIMYLENRQLITNIELGDFIISDETFVGDLATAILKANSSFQEDDFLSIILYIQHWNQNMNVPVANCIKQTLKLDSYDSTLLTSALSIVKLCNVQGKLSTTALMGDWGITMVHSRKRSNGRVAISTQCLEIQNELFAKYSSKEQQKKAMISYGVKEKAFLTPETASKNCRKNQGF